MPDEQPPSGTTDSTSRLTQPAGHAGAGTHAHTHPAAADPGLRRLLKWVFVVLILTVLFSLIAVEVTRRLFD
jgi:hypothetical protein